MHGSLKVLVSVSSTLSNLNRKKTPAIASILTSDARLSTLSSIPKLSLIRLVEQAQPRMLSFIADTTKYLSTAINKRSHSTEKTTSGDETHCAIQSLCRHYLKEIQLIRHVTRPKSVNNHRSLVVRVKRQTPDSHRILSSSYISK